MTWRTRLCVGLCCASLAAQAGAATRLAVIADTRGTSFQQYVNTNVLSRVVDRLLALDPPPAAVVVAGDLIYAPNNADNGYDQFTNVMHRLVTNGIPYYAALGECDYKRVTGWHARWANAFDFPLNGPAAWPELVYYVDIGDARVVVLDSVTAGSTYTRSYVNRIDAIQREWLKTVIGPNSPAPFDLVVAHQPAYPATVAHQYNCLSARYSDMNAFLQILTDARTTAFLAGHEQIYCRRMVDSRYNPAWTWTVPHFTVCDGAPLLTALNDLTPAPDATNTEHYTFLVIDLDPDTLTGTAKSFAQDTGELLDEASLAGKPFELSLSFRTTILPENAGTLAGWVTVRASRAPGEDLVVSLASGDTTELAVTNAVVIPAGTTSAPFDLTVLSDTVADGRQPVMLTAQAEGYGSATGIVEVVDTGGLQPRVLFGDGKRADRFAIEHQNLNMPGPVRENFSACARSPNEDIFPIVCKSAFTMKEYVQFYRVADGAYVTNALLQGFNDVEGICLVDPAGNTYAFVEESVDHVTIMTVTTNAETLVKSNGQILPVTLPYGKIINKGMEGVAYDPLNNCFYVIQEQSPMGVYRVARDGSNTVTDVLFDAEAVFSGVATDLSDVAYDPYTGHLFILSDESARVMECDLAGRILTILPLTVGQPEGIFLSADGSRLHIVGEPDEYYRYALASHATSGGEAEQVTIPLILTRPSAETVTVEYAVLSDTALFPEDYTPEGGVLTFTPGAVSAHVTLTVQPDMDVEPDEILVASITSVSNAATAHDNRATHTIKGDAFRLVVHSPFGTASPPVGTNYFVYKTDLTCAVLTSPVTLSPAGTQVVCTAWSGTGSVPESGQGKTTPAFSFTNDSEITWHWTTNVWLAAAADGGGTVTGGNRWIPLETNATLQACTNMYFLFAGWTGEVGEGSDTNHPVLPVIMDRARAITARFPLIPGSTTSNGIPVSWLAGFYGYLIDFDAVTESDTDMDGFTAWQEYISDTDPTNPASRLEIRSIRNDGPTIGVFWTGSTGRLYDVYAFTNLPPGVVPPSVSNLPGDPSGTTVFMESVATNGPVYYRIRARLPVD